jgi:hypothetical protein
MFEIGCANAMLSFRTFVSGSKRELTKYVSEIEVGLYHMLPTAFTTAELNLTHSLFLTMAGFKTR